MNSRVHALLRITFARSQVFSFLLWTNYACKVVFLFPGWKCASKSCFKEKLLLRYGVCGKKKRNSTSRWFSISVVQMGSTGWTTGAELAICKCECGDWWGNDCYLTLYTSLLVNNLVCSSPGSACGWVCLVIFIPLYALLMVLLMPFAAVLDLIQLLLWVLTVGCCLQCKPGLWARGFKTKTVNRSTYGSHTRSTVTLKRSTAWEDFGEYCCCCNGCGAYCGEIRSLRQEASNLWRRSGKCTVQRRKYYLYLLYWHK